MKKWKELIIVLMLIVSLVAPSVLSSPAVSVQAATIKLNKKALTLTVGKTATLKITGSKITPTWKSSNTKIVTVSSKGKVKAISAGTAKITATIKKTKLTCTVKVNPVKKSDQKAVTKKDSVFTLNEEGFFAKPFCKTIDLNGSVEYAALVMLFYINLKPETMKIADSYKKVSDVYESASLTFYPNGKVRVEYKLTDKFYKTFSERELFPTFVSKQGKAESDYKVNLATKEITIGDAKYTFNVADESITRESLLAKEVFSVNGKVEGDAPVVEEVKEKTYTLMKDVQYDSELSDDIAKMDVLVPNNLDKSKNNGAMAIVYGGGWTGGTKEGMESLGAIYAEAGYVVIIMNMHNAYVNETTKKTEVTVWNMLNDIQASVKKLKELSDEKGWNITQMGLYGGSSGANLALTYAYSRGTDVPYFDTKEILPVKFVVDLVGPVDMHESAWYGDEEWLQRDMMTAPGAGPLYAYLLTGAVNDPNMSEEEKEKHLNAMSPVWYVETYGAVPTVMGYSKSDVIQNPNNGKILKGYLDKKSVRNDLFTFPTSIHSFANDPVEAKQFHDKTLEYAKTYFN